MTSRTTVGIGHYSACPGSLAVEGSLLPSEPTEVTLDRDDDGDDSDDNDDSDNGTLILADVS